MKTRSLIHTLAAATLSALLIAQPVSSAEDTLPSQAALAFAGQFSDDQLSGMLSRIGGQSPAMVELSKLGGEFVAQIFDLQIDAAVSKYGDQWKRNMAAAWEPLLTADEMASILAEGAASEYSAKYTGLRSEAGRAMQGSSQELFTTILSEVIGETRRTLLEAAQEAPASD